MNFGLFSVFLCAFSVASVVKYLTTEITEKALRAQRLQRALL